MTAPVELESTPPPPLAERSVTEALASFVVGTRWEHIPDSARVAAKRSLVNIFGAALGGSREIAIQRIMSTLRLLSGPPQAMVIGRAERFDRPTSAFINAASANVLDFDDTHFPTIIHPSAPVFAPLLALAQARQTSGIDFLEAFTIGVEVACRLGNAVAVDHYRRGGHITATCGVIGAAAACAKLLRLDAEEVVWALGIAANRSAGLVENLGSAAKSIGVGGAARDGLMAALFSKAGINAASQAIEGPRGFLAIASRAPDTDVSIARLGMSWEIENNACKPYPCGVVLHPVIDAALEIAHQTGFDHASIDSILVEGHPLLLERADRPDVESGREAKLSIQHSVAAALVNRTAGVQEYLDEAVGKREIVALRRKVSASFDAGATLDSASMRVVFTDGHVQQVHIRHARGSLARPLSDAEISDKFIRLARWGSSGVRIERLLDALWAMERLRDIGPVIGFGAPA